MTKPFKWQPDVGIDVTFPDDKDRDEHLVEVILTNMGGEHEGVTVAYACTPAYAQRMSECVNALEGIDDPAGFIKMQREHVAAQHESLGRMADVAADTSKILGENGVLIGRALARISELEAALIETTACLYGLKTFQIDDESHEHAGLVIERANRILDPTTLKETP